MNKNNMIYIKIKQKGLILNIGGKVFRTPAKVDIKSKQQLNLIRSQMKLYGIDKYEIYGDVNDLEKDGGNEEDKKIGESKQPKHIRGDYRQDTKKSVFGVSSLDGVKKSERETEDKGVTTKPVRLKEVFVKKSDSDRSELAKSIRNPSRTPLDEKSNAGVVTIDDNNVCTNDHAPKSKDDMDDSGKTVLIEELDGKSIDGDNANKQKHTSIDNIKDNDGSFNLLNDVKELKEVVKRRRRKKGNE